MVVFCYHFDLLVEYLPQLYGFVYMSAAALMVLDDEGTICAEEEMSRVLPLAPLDPVDLLLDLERFKVIKFRLM
jgi:hypothetical protein